MLRAPAPAAAEPSAWVGASPAVAEADRKLGMRLTIENPKNMRLGIVALERAAAAGSADAAVQLGYLYSTPASTVRDSAKGMAFYKRAVALGSAYAMAAIGALYDMGDGVPVDHAAARNWYDKALALGLPDAMTGIGSQYDHGQGVAQNLTLALDWYRRAAAGGDPEAMGNLGFAYEFGRGVAKDLAAARDWYEKAIAAEDVRGKGDQRDEGAIVNLADMYITGTGVPADPAKGLALLQRGIDAGFLDAMTQRAIVEMDKPKPDGALVMRLLRRAVVGEGAQAELELSLALEAGLDGKRDYAEANVWYAKAATAGNDLDADNRANAAFGLGQNLLHGRGIEENLPLARTWLGKAAAGGSHEAAPVYAHMLLAGLGGAAQRDEALAVLQRSNDAAADMIRAAALVQGGPAGRQQAVAILTARARTAEGAVTMHNPWDCDGRLPTRSVAYDLAALASPPDAALMERAAAQGDPRGALWLGEVLAKRRQDWAKADALIVRAANAHLGAAYLALAELLLADGDRSDIASAADDLLLALHARDPRAIETLAAQPPKVSKEVLAAVRRKIAKDPSMQQRLGATSLSAAVAVARSARAAEPAATRTFCAVVHP